MSVDVTEVTFLLCCWCSHYDKILLVFGAYKLNNGIGSFYSLTVNALIMSLRVSELACHWAIFSYRAFSNAVWRVRFFNSKGVNWCRPILSLWWKSPLAIISVLITLANKEKNASTCFYSTNSTVHISGLRFSWNQKVKKIVLKFRKS